MWRRKGRTSIAGLEGANHFLPSICITHYPHYIHDRNLFNCKQSFIVFFIHISKVAIYSSTRTFPTKKPNTVHEIFLSNKLMTRNLGPTPHLEGTLNDLNLFFSSYHCVMPCHCFVLPVAFNICVCWFRDQVLGLWSMTCRHFLRESLLLCGLLWVNTH